ncbi:hypothetical protein FRC08_008098 [Ceratobasidium sp. 394]|nr:hypothetical protein FRC08_008098 [Ceratobasidium sp. 394]KAG9092180.1 hypothetical protein FS749_015942 [Ceratobasidium sp. UAMH 11750]
MPLPTIPSSDKPIIAVCGATGFQGGSVVKHLLRDGRFAVRGLTRNPESAHAKELSKNGVPLVQADFNDVESLRRAFNGCYGVYAVTDFFDAFDQETQQGINIVDAAKATGIKHLVFSAGDDRPQPVHAFKHKAAAVAYLKKSGVPYTALYLTWYYSNMFLFDAFQRNPQNGGWILRFPMPTDMPIPSLSPKDIGAYALAALANPSEWLGQDMRVCNEYITPRQFAETFAEVTGSHVDVIEVTRDGFFALENEPFILQAWGV